MKIMMGALLTMTACTTPSEGTPGAADRPGLGCDADKAKSVIGRSASIEAAEEAQRLSGASASRWLRPGQIVTMEYRDGRLNLKLDANDRIVALTCG